MKIHRTRWAFAFLCGAIAITTLLWAIGVRSAVAQLGQYPGFRVEGYHLYDRFGNKVVLVGVNKMVIYTDRDGVPAFAEIPKTGANVVRMAWRGKAQAIPRADLV